MTEKKIIWYRCKCGQAFSNEKEIEKPDVNYNTYGAVVRYYFEGGTVLYHQAMERTKLLVGNVLTPERISGSPPGLPVGRQALPCTSGRCGIRGGDVV